MGRELGLDGLPQVSLDDGVMLARMRHTFVDRLATVEPVPQQVIERPPTKGTSLRLLRLHSIRRLEVVSRISNELCVAWMIDSFHADDDIHQLGIVVVNVLDQFGLCIGWSCNENRTGVCN